MFEINIDVRWITALHTDKALEQQLKLIRVDRSNTKHETNTRICCRPPPLAKNLLLPGPTDDIPDRQKIIGKIEFLNQLQFVFDLPQNSVGWLVIELILRRLQNQQS